MRQAFNGKLQFGWKFTINTTNFLVRPCNVFNLLASHSWVVVFANTPSPFYNPFLWISYRKLSFCLPNITPPNSPKGFPRGLGPHGRKEGKDKIMGSTLFGLLIYAWAVILGRPKWALMTCNEFVFSLFDLPSCHF